MHFRDIKEAINLMGDKDAEVLKGNCTSVTRCVER